MWQGTLMLIFVRLSRALSSFQGTGCGALLTDAIVGSTISVTSSHNASFDEDHAVLNSSNAWCSSNLDTFQHLAVILDQPANISGFELQGRSSTNQYVTKFTMGYKSHANQNGPQDYPNDQSTKIFLSTPSDGDEILYFPLNETKMQTVVFYPFKWNGHICMRIELYGCVIVDGGYSPWSNWTSCSSSCGNGTSVRYRTCTDPAPANGGTDCIGESLQIRECAGTSCPVDGGFSNWSNWTACSVSCGTGFELRQRTCTNPLPMHGGKLCESRSSVDVRICFIEDCNPQADPAKPSACTAKNRGDEKKYLIPLLALAAALALVIVVSVTIICVTRKKHEHNRNNNSVENNSNGRTVTDHYEEIGTTSVNLAKG